MEVGSKIGCVSEFISGKPRVFFISAFITQPADIV